MQQKTNNLYLLLTFMFGKVDLGAYWESADAVMSWVDLWGLMWILSLIDSPIRDRLLIIQTPTEQKYLRKYRMNKHQLVYNFR